MVGRLTQKSKRTFEDTLKSARLGAPEAQYEVGLMYANGVGVRQDISQAVHWVSLAAQKGLAAAQYLLATRYENGIGLSQSTHDAVQWYGRAAEQGHLKALYRLSLLYARAQPLQSQDFLLKAAETGLAIAQCALGKNYLKGNDVAVNVQQALFWLEQAAAQNSPEAQFALGELSQTGKYGSPDPERALYWYRKSARQDFLAAQIAIEKMAWDGLGPASLRSSSNLKGGAGERRRKEDRWVRAAEKGGAEGRFQLGRMYEDGLGVDANKSLALHWYGLAAQLGHAEAQYRIGLLHEKAGMDDAAAWFEIAAEAGLPAAQFALGRRVNVENVARAGVEEGPFRRLGLWTRAAVQGHLEALVELGRWLETESQSLAASCYLNAANLGDAEGQYMLGRAIEKERGQAKSKKAAIAWYQQAALKGHAGAQYALGVACLTGKGLPRSTKEALRWLLKAAEQGHPGAQWNLGVIYTTGNEEIARDLKLALIWLQRSAGQGFVAALSNLGIVYALSGKKERAVEVWRRAAAKDDPEALYNLSLACSKGEGTEKDTNAAYAYLCRAAELGVVPAQGRLGLMYATGDGAVLDPIESVKWLSLAAEKRDKAAEANLQRALTLVAEKVSGEGIRRAKEWKNRALLLSENRSYR